MIFIPQFSNNEEEAVTTKLPVSARSPGAFLRKMGLESPPSSTDELFIQHCPEGKKHGVNHVFEFGVMLLKGRMGLSVLRCEAARVTK